MGVKGHPTSQEAPFSVVTSFRHGSENKRNIFPFLAFYNSNAGLRDKQGENEWRSP